MQPEEYGQVKDIMIGFISAVHGWRHDIPITEAFLIPKLLGTVFATQRIV